MEKNGQKVWGGILSSLKKQVSNSTFKTWFSGTVVLNYKDLDEKKLLIIGLKNNFLKEEVERRYSSKITEIKRDKGFNNLDVVFVVSQPEVKNSQLDWPLFSGEAKSVRYRSSKYEILNPNYKFETFVVGQSNNIAYVAASQVSNNSGNVYNPILFYGPTGVGKTHLLQAIGNAAVDKFIDAKILYVTSEKFTNDYIESIRNRQTQSFRQKYRNVDILLIDDIQFLAGKESTQDEFFHCFNELTISNRQVVIASDKHPQEMGRLKERLISRFLGGMVVDIGYPDFEMKMAIIKAKCKEKNVSMDDEIIAYIAQESSGGARELEGVLTSTLAQIKISGNKFNREAIKSVIYNNKLQNKQSISPNNLVAVVCKYYKVERESLKGQSRKANLVRVRQVLMYLLREELKLSLEAIGYLIGGRDHSTVIYGVEKIKSKLNNADVDLRDDISRIKGVLNKS